MAYNLDKKMSFLRRTTSITLGEMFGAIAIGCVVYNKIQGDITRQSSRINRLEYDALKLRRSLSDSKLLVADK